jgi:hypothetical protein
MSIQITIAGNVIDFPSSAQSPNWAPALIEFAQSVETALSGVVGPYDIAPTTINIVNTGIKTNILTLAFPTNVVRSVVVKYGFLRKTDSPSDLQYESGTLTLTSSENNWEIQREFVGNTNPIESLSGTITSGLMFYIDSSGQLSYDAAILAGTNYQGKLTFSAQALEAA